MAHARQQHHRLAHALALRQRHHLCPLDRKPRRSRQAVELAARAHVCRGVGGDPAAGRRAWRRAPPTRVGGGRGRRAMA
eukprot:5291535-Prymnesium_polylepis.1